MTNRTGFPGPAFTRSARRTATTELSPHAGTGLADAYGRGYRFTFHDAVVTGPGPDPTTLLLAGLGVIGLWRRRRHDARG